MRIVSSIERIDASATARIQECIANSTPIIITGLVPKWTSYGKWTPDFLVAEIGPAKVAFRRNPTRVHPEIDADGQLRQKENELASLAEYVRIMSEDPTVFLDGNLVCLAARRGKVNHELARLLPDVELPSFVRHEELDTIGLWLSGKGVRTRLHYDRNGRHNLNAQLRGEKELVLVAPSEFPKLSPISIASPIYNFTRVDNFAPDLRAHPRYSDVIGYSATLHEGDLLFLPAFWYHSFTHVGDFNLNLNFWFDAADVKMSAVALRNELATILQAMATNGDGADGSAAALARELDAYCLEWSPQRATVDEIRAAAAK